MAKRRMRFITWCKKAPNDETKIVYEFKTAEGKTKHFTSDDVVSFGMMERIRYAWVESVEYISSQSSAYWLAKIYED